MNMQILAPVIRDVRGGKRFSVDVRYTIADDDLEGYVATVVDFLVVGTTDEDTCEVHFLVSPPPSHPMYGRLQELFDSAKTAFATRGEIPG